MDSKIQAKKAEMDAAFDKYKALENEWVDLRIAREMQRFKEKGILPNIAIRFNPFRKKTEGVFVRIGRSQTCPSTDLIAIVLVKLKNGTESIFSLPEHTFDSIKAASSAGE